ncbi:hypothetical protein DFH28DRAFT_1058579 [Melampsora americana]|nr:hypothetical protein DFH28DRAFT_1058579 [Melampsora americana]
MGGKRLSRFFSSTLASTPKHHHHTPQGKAEFKITAQKQEERLNQIHNPPPCVPPPPPEWVWIVGNNDHDWIDASDNEDEGGEVVTPATYVHYQHYQKYFAKHQDFFHRWGQLKDQMMAMYLYCQHTTKSWTTQQTYHKDKPSGCLCTPEDHYPACQIDFIDMLGKFFTLQLDQTGPQLTSGYVQGLIRFTSSRTCRKLTAQGIKQKAHTLRVPFSNLYDVYACISQLSTSVYHDRMLHTNEELWAAKCAQCFGPARGEDLTNQDFFSIFCMDGNFQQRHNTKASKDQPLNDEYPSIFVKPSNIQRDELVLELTCNIHLEGGQVLLENSGKFQWLLTWMKQAHKTVWKSQALLTNIYVLPNPYQPGHVYTEEFFDKQWEDKRQAMVSPKVQQEIQKLELGKLLYLEDGHNQAWNTMIQMPKQAIALACLVGDLQKNIAAQKGNIGLDAMTDDLSGE